MKYKFIDLFCGAGGFSKGLELAGMVCIGGIDNVEKTVETHRLNHHESKSRGLDTTSEKYKRFVSEHDYMKDKWSNILYNDKFYNPNLSLKKAFVLDRK